MAQPPRLSDLLTTANLSSGVASILLASQGQLTIACWLIFIGALFDVFDGLAARTSGGGSEFGKQLDSLADVITFGTAPGMLIWHVHQYHLDVEWSVALPLAVTIIPIASAWRLAKFNIDTRQSTGFLGLPTPSNGLFWTGAVLVFLGIGVLDGPGSGAVAGAIELLVVRPSFTLVATLALAACMLSELPLPGLKFKHFKWRGNEVIFILVSIGIVLFALYGTLAIPLVLVIYLLSPLWGKVFGR